MKIMYQNVDNESADNFLPVIRRCFTQSLKVLSYFHIESLYILPVNDGKSEGFVRAYCSPPTPAEGISTNTNNGAAAITWQPPP